MIYAGSVVNINPEDAEKAVELIEAFEEFDVHAVSDDKTQIVISIEAESDKHIERVCAELKSNAEIIDIGHHVFNFEEEVERIEETGEKPELTGFFRSQRREEKEKNN